ncbi:MAG: D-inositol-3-phosphate glycosyltransferase [Lawsonella sp.]
MGPSPHSLHQPVRRVALLSMHTSPLAQPGMGDAGGMNVFILQTARQLARCGVEVEIFTRATKSSRDPIEEEEPGVRVRHVLAGPFGGLTKYDLPQELCSFAHGVMQVEARHEPGYFDLIHSHYWLSGQVGLLAAPRWRVPLVHTFHTVAAVKNATLAAGDTPEPQERLEAEARIAQEATRLTANTPAEKQELVKLLHTESQKIDVIPPGADLSLFTPGGPGATEEARRKLGLRVDDQIVAFVGRIQPLKAPDVLVAAAGELFRRRPGRNLTIVIVGGPSGSGMDRPTRLEEQVRDLGIASHVKFFRPMPPHDLVEVFRAADVVAVPSHNESFGLVALEAQACGTAVVAANVGGLSLAVDDGVSGLLVDGHDPQRWADVLEKVLDDDALRIGLAISAPGHAFNFSWVHTARGLIKSYQRAREQYYS